MRSRERVSGQANRPGGHTAPRTVWRALFGLLGGNGGRVDRPLPET